MADRGKKERKKKIQKFEYLENEKSFLDEIKNISNSFWRNIIWWKRTIWYKIASTALSYGSKSYWPIRSHDFCECSISLPLSFQYPETCVDMSRNSAHLSILKAVVKFDVNVKFADG